MTYYDKRQIPEGVPSYDELTRALAAAARPFLFIDSREMSVLRRGLTKDGWKRRLYLQDAPADPTQLTGAGILARANRRLEKSVNIPARGGSAEDFFCDGGSCLTLPADCTRKPKYMCPVCGTNYTGGKYDAAIRWFEHQSLANDCLALSIVFQIERNPAYAEKAVEILRAYADTYSVPKSGISEGVIAIHSADEARWAVPLAQAYDLIFYSKAITRLERYAIEQNLFRRVADGLRINEPAGCAAAWQIAALGLIGCAIRDAGLLHWAIDSFAHILQNELGDEGIFPGSLDADHFRALSAFVFLAEAYSRMGVDLYSVSAGENRNLKSMFVVPLKMMYPSFELPSIDDGRFGCVLPLHLYEAAYRRWHDPLFAWTLKTGYGFAKHPAAKIHLLRKESFERDSLYALLLGRDLPRHSGVRKLHSMVMEDAGVCLLRHGGESGSTVTMDFGSPPNGDHCDQMGITLFAAGRLICPDYGVPGRGSRSSEYYRSTACHNTVMVDGKNRNETAGITLQQFSAAEYLQIVEAETDEVHSGVTHRRRIVMAGDITVVSDTLESNDPHSYDSMFRFEGRLRANDCKKSCSDGLHPMFCAAVSAEGKTQYGLQWENEDVGLAAHFAMDAPGMLITARCPAECTARTVPVAIARRHGSNARFDTILSSYTNTAPRITKCGSVYKIVREGACDWIRLADAACIETAGSDEIESDGGVAAVREVNGQLVAFGVYNGSYIRLRGEWILLAAGRFDRIEVLFNQRGPAVSFEGAEGDYLRLKCSSKAMNVNGNHISASTSDGIATIRLVGALAR